MRKEEVVRQYKLLRVFHPILRILEEVVIWLVLPLLICIIINIRELYILYLIYAYLIFMVILKNKDGYIFRLKTALTGASFTKINLGEGFSFHLKTPLTDLLLRSYEEKWGMSMEQVKNYIEKRAVFEGKSIPYIFPLLHRLSKLNESDRNEQEIFLSDRFSEGEIQQIFETEISDSLFDETISYWRKVDLSERKTLVELLFKFTIVEDGIHNDEWHLLLDIMIQLKFNKYYVEYFKKRYSSLRTEFDEYKRSSLSLKDYGVSLQPYYSVLGLEEGATDEEIKRAYHELAMQHHPDLPKNADRKEECEAKMMEINEAYEKVRG